MREKKDTRIFFALWPDDALRQVLKRAADTIPVQAPARRVADYNLHMTLHFIGNVELAKLACLQQQARKVRAPAFDLCVDTQGCFGKARVAWLGCSEPPARLCQLHQELGRRLRRCEFQPEARRYNPHVTMARKIRFIPADPDFEPLQWRVENFVLVESKFGADGVKYSVIETYPLT
ncbi:MAG: RNA 2',3'-cyclic phosphodiesterase [Gammaproteobacteria bacterium]|nr:RNA 2',3'-cyclic phosphodiesterase [Gammaproteobacteria bacterium]